MCYFVNLFLLAYLADGSVSVADEFLIRSFELNALSRLREALAYITLGLAAATYIFLAIDRRIPKRVVLPPIIYLISISLIGIPLGGVVDNQNLSTIFSIGQLLVALSVFINIHSRFKPSFLLGASAFEGSPFNLKHTALYLVASAGAAIVVLPVVLYFLTVKIVNHSTAEFIRVDTQGIYLTEKHFHDGAKTVYLMPMMHVAETNFYTEITDALASNGAIVLAEGVSDDSNLMSEFRGTGKAAELLGLDSQTTMAMPGDHIEFEQIADPVDASATTSEVKIVRADIDSSELSSKTLEFLNAAGRYLNAHEQMFDVFLSFYRWSNEHLTAAEQNAIYAEVLDKRNDVLLRHLAEALLHFDEILVPWGALHMPAFETYLKAQGFNLADQRERRAVAFWVENKRQ